MLNVFYEIGQILPLSLPYQKVKENSFLLIMDASKGRIFTEKMDNVKVKKYCWLGNVKGNIAKDYLIVSGEAVRYLIFFTPFYFLEKNFKTLKNNEVFKNFLKRLGNLITLLGVLEIKTNNKKPLKMLNVYNLLDNNLRQKFLKELKARITQETSQNLDFLESKGSESENFENFIKNVFSLYSKNEDFEKAFSEVFYNIHSQDFEKNSELLWTFADEKGIITKDPGYRYYIEEKFFKIEGLQEGICRICNNHSPVTSKTTYFKFFKFWNTDKPGFAPLWNEKLFASVFALCPECYKKVFVADHFIWEHFNTTVCGLKVILLPHPVKDRYDLKELAELLKKRLNAIDTVKAIKEFENTLKEQKELWETLKKEQVFINFVFYESSRSAVKVMKVIHEVPPTRLDKLDEVRKESLGWAQNYFKDVKRKNKSPWDLDLSTQFSLIPAYKNVKTPSLFLNYLEALFHREPFPKETLIKGFLKIAKAHHLGFTKEFKGLPSERNLETFMVQTLIFLRYLKNLDIIKLSLGGGVMIEKIPEHLKTYLSNEVPEGKSQALFLVGYVIGMIAQEQQAGKDFRERKSPPILNAISFTGMDDNKIRRLINYVADKMRHYLKGWNYKEAENILSAAIYLFEKYKKSLPSYENTYWVLAGYGFYNLGLGKKDNKEGAHD